MSVRLRLFELTPCLLLACSGIAGPATAEVLRWEGERGSASIRLSGREIFSSIWSRSTEDLSQEIARNASDPTCHLAVAFEDCPAFGDLDEEAGWQNLSRLRVDFSAELHTALSTRIVYDHELAGGELDAIGGRLLDTPATFLGAEWDITWAPRLVWRHALYRAYVRLEHHPLRVTVGRQRIPWGVGRLWKPIDRFNAIPPLAIEQDQSPGVDAVEVRWAWGSFAGVQAVYAPGDSSGKARYALRASGVVFDVDAGAVVGRFEEAFTAGAYVTGNVFQAAYRLEAVWSDPGAETWPIGKPAPGEPASYWQLVASIDRTFDLGSGLYVLLEQLYNGNALGFGSGEAGALLALFESTPIPPPGLSPADAAALGGPFVRPASPAVAAGSRVVTGARHLTGVQLSYEWASSLRAQTLAIWDWRGRSAAIFPRLTYRGWNAAEVGLGAQVFIGPDESEYGLVPDRVFVQLDFFF